MEKLSDITEDPTWTYESTNYFSNEGLRKRRDNDNKIDNAVNSRSSDKRSIAISVYSGNDIMNVTCPTNQQMEWLLTEVQRRKQKGHDESSFKTCLILNQRTNDVLELNDIIGDNLKDGDSVDIYFVALSPRSSDENIGNTATNKANNIDKTASSSEFVPTDSNPTPIVRKNTATMLQSGEIVVVSPSRGGQCTICNGKWKDKTPVLYEFTSNGAIAHFACLQVATSIFAACPDLTQVSTYKEFLASSIENQAGVFHIEVERAVELPKTQLIGRADPYVIARLSPWNEPTETKAVEKGGRNPIWISKEHNSSLKLLHPYNSETTPIPVLNIQIWNLNYLADDLMGEVDIDMSPLLKHPNVSTRRWFSLNGGQQERNNKDNGKILLSMTFQPHEQKNTAEDTHNFRLHSVKKTVGKILHCAVCDKLILLGIKGGGYRCEICSIDVHKMCMLQCHTKFPCQSVEDVPQRRTSLSVAGARPSEFQPGEYLLVGQQHQRLIGKLYIHLIGVHICSEGCHDDDHARYVYERDSYCRLEFQGDQYETPPVVKTADPSFNAKICYGVINRNSTLKFHAIDLNTNSAIGEMQMSLFQLLQRDSDLDIQRYFLGEYFTANQGSQKPKSLHKLYQTKGKPPVGYAMIDIYYEEYTKELFFPLEESLASKFDRENHEFSIEMLRHNLDRLDNIVNFFRELEDMYDDIIAWKNKPISFISLVTFVFLCLNFDAEYAPALVFYACAIFMAERYVRRLDGTYVKSWVTGNVDCSSNSSRTTTPFRPVAILYIAVLEAKLVNSQGITRIPPPGVFVRVHYRPNDRENTGGKSPSYVPTGGDSYLIGETHAVRHASHPKWTTLPNPTPPSVHAERTKDSILRNVMVSWQHLQDACSCRACDASSKSPDKIPPGVDHHAFRYPIVQPLHIYEDGKQSLVPWKDIPGELFLEIFNDYDHGETAKRIESVHLPLSSLLNSKGNKCIRRHDEIDVWLDLKEKTGKMDGEQGEGGLLRLRVLFDIPSSQQRMPPTDLDRAYSNYLIDVMKGDRGSGLGILDAYRKARETSKTMQNELGKFCETIETIKNALNWTHPRKTLMLIGFCFLCAVVFSKIKARYLILLGGLSEFAAVLRQNSPPSLKARDVIKAFLTTIPTDDDLLYCYDEQRREYLRSREKIKEEIQDQVTMLKLQALWKGNLHTKIGKEKVWKQYFAVYRRHRIVFWKNQEDAENGACEIFYVLLQDFLPVPLSQSVKSGDQELYVFISQIKSAGVSQEERYFACSSEVQRDELIAVIKNMAI